MEIILSVYACGPNKGSEIGLGWNWVYFLSEHIKLHVITENEFKLDIEQELRKWNQKYKPTFYFLDVGSDKVREICWNQGDYRFYYYYRKWQYKAYVKAQEIVNSNNILLLHQLNMIGYREPGYLWKIDSIPFIWGPIGGFGRIKMKYLPSLGLKNGLFYFIKNILNTVQFYSPRVIKAMYRAKLLLSANIESYNIIKKIYNKESILFNETGAKNLGVVNYKGFSKDKNELNVLWVGKFVARKALNIALKTMSHLKGVNINMKIIGEGNNSNHYKELSLKLGINNKISWLGVMDNKQVLEEMIATDVLLFTSLDEGTPHVVLESLACGMPVLCHDICGQSTVVNSNCGFKIKVKSPLKSAKYFADILLLLLNNPNKLEELKSGALERSKELLWSKKALQMVKYYEESV